MFLPLLLKHQVVSHGKFNFISGGYQRVLHDRPKVNDDPPDILDVHKGNQREFTVNCNCLFVGINEQKNKNNEGCHTCFFVGNYDLFFVILYS